MRSSPRRHRARLRHLDAAGAVPAGALYRILPDGAWDLLWESRADTPYDVAVDADGSILVATGNSGKIFRLAGDPFQPTLIARANAQQVTGLAATVGRTRAHRDVEPGQAAEARRGARRSRHVYLGCPRRADGGAVGHAQVAVARHPRAAVSKSRLARGTRTRRMRPGATGVRRTPIQKAARSRAREHVTSSGARRSLPVRVTLRC